MLTIPKLMTPFQIDLGMVVHLSSMASITHVTAGIDAGKRDGLCSCQRMAGGAANYGMAL
jgi:hypothetical protein